MTESRMRSILVKILSPVGAFPIENPAHPGTPDVMTVVGALELKRIRVPPELDHRVGRIIRNEQLLWHRRWIACGGLSWLVTLVGTEWIIHDGSWIQTVNGATFSEFLEASTLRTSISGDILCHVLSEASKNSDS